MVELQEYVDLEGRNAFNRWYQSLESNTRSRVVTALNRLRHNSLAMKGVGGGILELRLHFGPGYRVYFGKDGETLVILLCGGSKKRQNADIEVAKELWSEYKKRSDTTY